MSRKESRTNLARERHRQWKRQVKARRQDRFIGARAK
jgi:hypothetical protein